MTIREGSKVIIRRDSFLRIEDVCRGKKVVLQKLHFFLDNAIGCPYGSTFEVKDHHLSVKAPCDSTVNQSQSTGTSGESNQFINDNGSSQKLSRDDIMALKADGVAGKDIINQLVENSDSFDKKTEFSQEKYLKKKKKRHIVEITILKPTLALICEMLYANSPKKILDLRMDTVSQILTMANVQSNINVMLLENTQSFLAGLILHQMGGLGNLVQVYHGDFPVRLCLACFDLEKKNLEILNGFPMAKIDSLRRPDVETGGSCTTSCEITTGPENISTSHCGKMELNTDAVEECPPSNNTNDKSQDMNRSNRHKALSEEEKLIRKKSRDVEEEKARKVLKKHSMDSLIIATKFRARTALLNLIEFLAPSRPLVVYSPYKEILIECYVALKKLQNVVLLNLTETWWRSYQVLASRTHPQIMMDGSGGYLLTGIKVDNAQDDSTDGKLTRSSVKKPRFE